MPATMVGSAMIAPQPANRFITSFCAIDMSEKLASSVVSLLESLADLLDLDVRDTAAALVGHAVDDRTHALPLFTAMSWKPHRVYTAYTEFNRSCVLPQRLLTSRSEYVF